MTSATLAQATLKIVVAGRDEESRRFLRGTLEGQCNYQVLEEASTGTALQRATLAREPDVIVFDMNLPGINGLEALAHIYQEHPVAAVILAEYRDQMAIQNVLHQYYMTYLLKPVEAHHIEPAVRVAWTRYKEYRELSDNNTLLRRNLQNRKTVERAKGVLMKRFRLTEEDAYRRLQRAAMNRRMPLSDLAQAVLNGTEMQAS